MKTAKELRDNLLRIVILKSELERILKLEFSVNSDVISYPQIMLPVLPTIRMTCVKPSEIRETLPTSSCGIVPSPVLRYYRSTKYSNPEQSYLRHLKMRG
jgi:hypothetical protein